MGSNPFGAAKAPEVPTAPTAPTANAAPVAPTAPAAPSVPPTAPVTPAAPVAGKKERKKPNRAMTGEERKYVLESYETKTTSEIAHDLNLTRQQVYRTVRETRQKLVDRIAQLEASQDPADAPRLETARTMLAKLPAKPFGGGQGGAKKGNSIDNLLDELLS